MITIDFAPFIKHGSFSEYIDYFVSSLKVLKKGYNFKKALLNEVQNKKETCLKEDFTDKEYEIFQFKIDNIENLFYFCFSQYENLKNFSQDEKIKFSIDLLFDLIWNTQPQMRGFRIYQLKKRFINDSREYFSLKSRENQQQKQGHDINEIDDVDKIINKSTFDSLKDIFINKELFDKIDFSKLKNYNVIFKNKESNDFELNKRHIADFLILISYLEKSRLIKFNSDSILEQIQKLIHIIFDNKIDNSRISRIRNRIVFNSGSYNLSRSDKETLEQIQSFISKNINTA